MVLGLFKKKKDLWAGNPWAADKHIITYDADDLKAEQKTLHCSNCGYAGQRITIGFDPEKGIILPNQEVTATFKKEKHPRPHKRKKRVSQNFRRKKLTPPA